MYHGSYICDAMTASSLTKDESDMAVRFMKIYANLPLEERSQVVVVLNEEPISWEVARNEIIHNTKKGKEILKKLKKLNII